MRGTASAARWRRRRLALAACFVSSVYARCEPWCSDSCTALNGNVQLECDACTSDEGHRCYPGAPGWDSWEERSTLFHASIGAKGQVTKAVGEDGVIERTSKSVVYEAPYYEVARRRRDAGSEAVGSLLGGPIPVPQESARNCSVHACVLVDGDDACADGLAACTAPRGHLRPIGEQFAHVDDAMEHDGRETPLDAHGFWTTALSKSRPLVLRGGTSAATDLSAWSDDALLTDCKLEDGKPWQVLVEKQNRITQNDRHPLMAGWTFCQFLQSYRTPEYMNMLYLVNALPREGRLRARLGLPSVLRCDALYTGLHDARLWMSRGNTTSSLHFDTHENLLMQIDGAKEVLLWHPNAVSAHTHKHTRTPCTRAHTRERQAGEYYSESCCCHRNEE